MANPLRLQPSLTAVDQWPRGVTYVRRCRAYKKDETGNFVALDLSAFPNIRMTLEGPDESRAAEGFVSASWDEGRGGAAEGAFQVVAVAETLDLDRGGELDWVRWTAVAYTSSEQRLIGNVQVTIVETAAA